MQFIPADSDHATQMKALLKQAQSLSLSALVCFLLTDEHFNLLRNETADGGSTTRGEDLRLPDRLPVETDRQILFGYVARG
jgi:hypothetical protein